MNSAYWQKPGVPEGLSHRSARLRQVPCVVDM